MLSHNARSVYIAKIQNFRARKLLAPLIENGKRVAPVYSLQEISAYRAEEYARFWEEYTRQDMPHIYKVDLSEELYELKRAMVQESGKGA